MVGRFHRYGDSLRVMDRRLPFRQLHILSRLTRYYIWIWTLEKQSVRHILLAYLVAVERIEAEI